MLSNPSHWHTNFILLPCTSCIIICILFLIDCILTKIKSFQIKLCVGTMNRKLQLVAVIKINCKNKYNQNETFSSSSKRPLSADISEHNACSQIRGRQASITESENTFMKHGKIYSFRFLGLRWNWWGSCFCFFFFINYCLMLGAISMWIHLVIPAS